MRLVNTITHGNFQARIYRDAEWNEFRVKYDHQGKHLGEEADSFADSRQDAEGTAIKELKFLEKAA